MSATARPMRSQACAVDTHLSLHKACTGQYRRQKGQYTTDTDEGPCSCPCHVPGTELHRKVRPR